MMDVSLVLLPGSRGKPKPFIHRHLLSYETHTLTHTFFFPLLSSISIYTTALEPVTERHIQTFKTLSPFEVSRVILPRNFARFSVWFMLCCFLSIPLLFIKPRWGCKCMKPAVRARVCVCVYARAFVTVWKLLLTVPILACGGDDSRVHLYVQADGQVSSGWYFFQEMLFYVLCVYAFLWISTVRGQCLTLFNPSTIASESHVPARTWRLGSWSGVGIYRWVVMCVDSLYQLYKKVIIVVECTCDTFN